MRTADSSSGSISMPSGKGKSGRNFSLQCATAIANLVADGGFPPLTLQPINFEQLYAQRMQQMAAEQANGAGEEETVSAEFSQND